MKIYLPKPKPKKDEIETIRHKPKFSVPQLDHLVGRKLRQRYYDEAVSNNRIYQVVLETVGEPVIAYFNSDRKVIAFSGGGEYIIREKDGKKVREWMPYCLNRPAQEEVESYLEVEEE